MCECDRGIEEHRRRGVWREQDKIRKREDESNEQRKRWGMAGKGGRSVSSWLLGKLPPSFVFLWYTPALQHSLQELRECSLFHILCAASEETNRLDQNVPAQLSCDTNTHTHQDGLSSAYNHDLKLWWRLCCSYPRIPRAAQSYGLTHPSWRGWLVEREGSFIHSHILWGGMREYPTMHWESEQINLTVLL